VRVRPNAADRRSNMTDENTEAEVGVYVREGQWGIVCMCACVHVCM
jgi:hypothetical protein